MATEPATRSPRVELYWSPVSTTQLVGGLRVHKVTGHEVRWRLVGANGEIVLPGEGHRDRTNTIRAINRAAELLAGLTDGSTELTGPGPAPL